MGTEFLQRSWGLWLALPFSQLVPFVCSLWLSLFIHPKGAVDLGIKAGKHSGYSVIYQNKGVIGRVAGKEGSEVVDK